MTQAIGPVSATFNLPIASGVAVPWRYLAASDHTGHWLDADGEIVATAIHNTTFAIAPEGDTAAGAGTMTLLATAPASATQLRLYRKTPPVQLYEPTPGAEGAAQQLDRTILHLQELAGALADIGTGSDNPAADAAMAKLWATAPYGTEVLPGLYSARHYAQDIAASTALIAEIDGEVDLLKIGPSEILTAGDPLITHWKAAFGIYQNTVDDGPHLTSNFAHQWVNAHPDFPVTIPDTGAYAGMIEIKTAGASTQNGAWVYQEDDVLARAKVRFGTLGMAGEGHRAVMYMPMAFNFDPSAVTATSPETASGAGVVPHPWFDNALTPFKAYRPDPNKEGLTRIEHPSIGNDQTTRTITQKGHPVKAIWMGGTSTSTDIQMVGQLAGLFKKDGAAFAYFGNCQEKPSWSMDGAGVITVLYNQVTFPVGGDRELAFFIQNYTDDTYPTTIRRTSNTGFTFVLKRHSDNTVVTSSTGVEFAFFLDWEVPQTIRSGAGGIRVEGGVSMVHAGEVVHNTASFGFMSMTPFKS